MKNAGSGNRYDDGMYRGPASRDVVHGGYTSIQHRGASCKDSGFMRKDDTDHSDAERTCGRHEQLKHKKGATTVHSEIQLTRGETAGTWSHFRYQS